MTNEFNSQANGVITKDDNGSVQSITHFENPILSTAQSVQQAAQEYLLNMSGVYNINSNELNSLSKEMNNEVSNDGLELRFENEKSQFDTSTVSYIQAYKGIPIFGAGVTVQIKHNPYRILSSVSTNHVEVNIPEPKASALKKYKSVSLKELKAALGADFKDAKLKILSDELNVYLFKSSERVVENHHSDDDTFCNHDQHLKLESLNNIVDDTYYFVSKVTFSYQVENEIIPCVALIEIETDSVLYFREFSSGVTGMIFNSDPYTMTGNNALGPGANDAALNPLRVSAVLKGLVPPVGGIQRLEGNYVVIKDIETPNTQSPTKPANAPFDFNVRSDEFAAVNAYYNNDRFFRMVNEMGFPATYWGTTVFPHPVDHRGLGNNINAHCVGNGSKGIGHTCYALASAINPPLGIALDWRVVLHELGGHGILYCSTNSPNFGFAHSAGDSFAAILNDPGNAHPDRFATFPWLIANRRHDRSVATGWAWGGSNDTNGYNSEQILSTTLFRLYRAIGGDSTDMAIKNFAARMTSYLILRAIGNLSPTHTTQTGIGLAKVTAFCNELISANLGDWISEGHTGGAYGKVIRWAFEKQGLFQLPGAPSPVATEGKPPAVDVYINDGRNGEYTYIANFRNNQNIWNRRSPDGLVTHQDPVFGSDNYVYVKIKNRGTVNATNVTVQAYQSKVRAGLEFPIDWKPMLTPSLIAPVVPANNASEVVVGPFKWNPSQIGFENITIVLSTVGDLPNTSNLIAGERIPEWRLIPNDNNIGQRTVSPKMVV